MTEEAAQLALEERLKTMIDRPPTLWVNLPLEGSVDTCPRLEVSHGPVSPQPVGNKGSALLNMLSQIDVVVRGGTGPNSGGSGGARGLTTAIVCLYPFGTVLGPARVYRRPEISGGRKDGDEFRTTITVRYRIAQGE